MDERNLSLMVEGRIFLSLNVWRQVSETCLTKAITGSKCIGGARASYRMMFVPRDFYGYPSSPTFKLVVVQSKGKDLGFEYG